jgi:hypothetical protein
MKATVKIAELKAMSVFAGTEDKRKFLNAVRVEVMGHQTLLIASNGHVMGVLCCESPEQVDIEPGVVTVPLDAIKALKTTRFLQWVTVSTIDDPGVVVLDDQQGERAIVQPDGHDVAFSWRRVVPVEVSHERAEGFDSEYLGRFAAFAKIMKGKRDYKQMIRVFDNGNDAAIVKLSGFTQFFAVLMAMRHTKNGPPPREPTLPDWFTSEAPESVDDLV